MGLAPGGRMRQEIYDDPYGLAEWDLHHSARCFIQPRQRRAVAEYHGGADPTPPVTAQMYEWFRLPWFEYYAADLIALPGAAPLAGLTSVGTLAAQKGQPLADNAPVTPGQVIVLGTKDGKRAVREGSSWGEEDGTLPPRPVRRADE